MKVTSGIMLLALFLSAFALVGCTVTNEVPNTTAVVCNKPYILVGTSCCLDSNNNGICDKDEVQTPSQPTTPDNNPPPATQTEYKLTRGDSVTVDGKKFTLVDFSIFATKLEINVNVDGQDWALYETGKPQIFNGLSITAVSIDRFQTYVILKIEPFNLGPDEYIVKYRQDYTIQGKVVQLFDVQDNNGALVKVDDLENVLIVPGDTKQVGGLKITDVEYFYRDLTTERYAILKIVKA